MTAAATPHEVLALALADAIHAGLRIPCTEDDSWLSDDAQARAEAAERCDGCPCLTQCADAGRTETWGVWGRVDRAPRHPNAGRPKRATR